MSGDRRNTVIVAAVIGSMTIGAGLLLWLEPATPGWSPGALLMAESVRAIEDVRVEYVPSVVAIEPGVHDGLVRPNGACEWRPGGPRIRLAVVGSDTGSLPRAQAETLLAVFGSMTQRYGLDLERVWLDPASDARLHPELPAQAHDLCNLLVRKGIIR